MARLRSRRSSSALCTNDALCFQIINCFEMSDHDGKLFVTAEDPLRPCYSGCFTPEFFFLR